MRQKFQAIYHSLWICDDKSLMISQSYESQLDVVFSFLLYAQKKTSKKIKLISCLLKNWGFHFYDSCNMSIVTWFLCWLCTKNIWYQRWQTSFLRWVWKKSKIKSVRKLQNNWIRCQWCLEFQMVNSSMQMF